MIGVPLITIIIGLILEFEATASANGELNMGNLRFGHATHNNQLRSDPTL